MSNIKNNTMSINYTKISKKQLEEDEVKVVKDLFPPLANTLTNNVLNPIATVKKMSFLSAAALDKDDLPKIINIISIDSCDNLKKESIDSVNESTKIIDSVNESTKKNQNSMELANNFKKKKKF